MCARTFYPSVLWYLFVGGSGGFGGGTSNQDGFLLHSFCPQKENSYFYVTKLHTMPGTEIALIALFSLLSGMVGGFVACGYRLLHLEMEWHSVRKDLRTYYTRMRNDRPLLVEPKSSFEDQILDIQRRNPLLTRRGE